MSKILNSQLHEQEPATLRSKAMVLQKKRPCTTMAPFHHTAQHRQETATPLRAGTTVQQHIQVHFQRLTNKMLHTQPFGKKLHRLNSLR